MPSPNLDDLHENRDGSSFNWEDIIPGYSSLTEAEREVFFLRDNITQEEHAAAELRGAKMSLYLPNGNEERIKKAYENRDPRLEANVLTPYSTFRGAFNRSEEHTSELQSLMRISYAVFCLKKKTNNNTHKHVTTIHIINTSQYI